MRVIEYARLRRRGVWNAWRLTKWDEADGLMLAAAVVAVISALAWAGLEYYEQQAQRIGDLDRLIEMHREVIDERETAIITLLNGGMVKADTDVVTCRVRDAASVRKWQ